MTLFKAVFALSLCLLILRPAPANAEARISQATLAPLATWVGENTHTDMRLLPTVTVDDARLSMALHIEDVQQAGAMGAYLPGRIFISTAVGDANSLQAQSYIVHELVHHAQLISGRIYPCHAAKEREAYMLQNKWLTEHGEAPLVNQDWINHMSSCPASVSE